MFKIRCLFFIIPILSFCLFSQQSPNSVASRRIVCTANDKWVKSYNCTIIPVRKKGNLLFVDVDLARKIYKPKIHVKLLKWDNGYREFLIDKKVDLCTIWGESNTNPIHIIIRNILKYNSNLNHTCPYEGTYYVPGIVPTIEFIPSVLVAGNYRILINFTADNDEWGGSMNFYATIKSSLLD